jgi:hypothetical protein
MGFWTNVSAVAFGLAVFGLMFFLMAAEPSRRDSYMKVCEETGRSAAECKFLWRNM